MKQGTQSWCSGTTQRDGVGRDVGEVSGLGDTCTPMAESCRCIAQSFGLCGRGRGWDDLGEWHWNMYNIIYETSHQSRFDARYWMLGAGALGWPRGMVWGGRREEGSEWGTRVYLWWIHFDIWQNQYNIVKLKNKIKFKKKINKMFLKSKRIPEKHLLLLYWLCQRFQMCISQ